MAVVVTCEREDKERRDEDTYLESIIVEPKHATPDGIVSHSLDDAMNAKRVDGSISNEELESFTSRLNDEEVIIGIITMEDVLEELLQVMITLISGLHLNFVLLITFGC